ncbi:MAG: Rpn family recombination-promoting nuclease/putative transposase [Treponema sp.]|nr:Rpn family recombination-promoting nuclease/putative transposase [Treponema sp.]
MSEPIYRKKTIEELTFTDDGMFQAVLREPEICAELIERLLHLRIKTVEYPELEKTIAPYYSTKGVRLDVYLKDDDKIIDIEIQSYPQEALGKRTRYYQSMIDMDSLMKGQDYPELKESYILFICKEDPFKDDDDKPFGLPCYTFMNICQEHSGVNLDDKSIKVIYNASAYEKETDEKIRNLLHFISTNEPGKDDFSNRLSSIVEKLKENEEFRSDYAAMNLHDRDIQRAARREGIAEGIAQGITQGIAQGAREKAIETARNLKQKRIPLETIAECVGLSVEEIEKL